MGPGPAIPDFPDPAEAPNGSHLTQSSTEVAGRAVEMVNCKRTYPLGTSRRPQPSPISLP